jgi:putative flippase GtrA
VTATSDGCLVGTQTRQGNRTSAAERAGELLTGWVDRLPARIRRWLPRQLVGFAILGGCTFLIDLALLACLRTWTRLPLPVAVSLSYVLAFGLNFLLNRTVNFRSHAPVGRQALRYALVVGCDYGLTVGVTTGLSALGMDFRVARVLAAVSVAAFTYTASRWWVFREDLAVPLAAHEPATVPRPSEVSGRPAP